MSEDIEFDRSKDAASGVVVEVAPEVRRVIAPNPSAFTFTGTASYIVGRGTVAVIDPGPDDPAHREAVLKAIGGATVSHVVTTHSHMDHTAGARAFAQAVAAPLVGAGPHRSFRPLHAGEVNRLEAGADVSYRPDQELADGEGVSGPGWSLVAVATPGHTANHLCYAMPGRGLLFSGDHVMAWSTTIVAPPDGAMGPYVASLRKLLERSEDLYLPGHGPALHGARKFTRHLLGHRQAREAAIREQVSKGARLIPEIVASLYRDLDARLVGAAGLSVFAHLEELVARGEVVTDGAPQLEGEYRSAA